MLDSLSQAILIARGQINNNVGGALQQHKKKKRNLLGKGSIMSTRTVGPPPRQLLAQLPLPSIGIITPAF